MLILAMSCFIDACLSGIGALWQDRVYVSPVQDIPNFFTNYCTSGDDQFAHSIENVGRILGTFDSHSSL